MSYNLSKFTFPSSDGVHTIYAEIYTPSTEPKGIVQLSHGMIDYTARYEALAEALTEAGYIFAGHHHLGHGYSTSSDSDFGFFASKGGVDFVVDDVYGMNRELKKMYPDLPICLMGHSMGSFIARLYAVKYRESIDGVIIHGTAGPNPLAPVGIGLVSLLKLFKGERAKSKLVDDMAFSSYNKKFPKEEGENAWLTRDVERVNCRQSDKFTSFKFSLGGYGDLFRMIRDCNSKSWFNSYPVDLPTLVISGEMDPVGNYGEGPRYVYESLKAHGCESLELKMYGDDRHELFNEFDRDTVLADMTAWLTEVCK